MPKRATSARRSRSSVRRNGSKSEYAKAARQTDGSRFVVMAQRKGEFTILRSETESMVQNSCPMVAMLESQMGQQLTEMYDEFRIKSFKAKIMLILGTSTGQFQLHTAFDRNGKLAFYQARANPQHNTVQEYKEPQAAILTYSSLQTKQIVQYQSGTLTRQLAATGSLESQFLPTALVGILTMGNEGDLDKANVNAGFRFPPWNQGFNPNLILALEAMTPDNQNDRTIRYTIDYSFDVAVRGLRNHQEV